MHDPYNFYEKVMFILLLREQVKHIKISLRFNERVKMVLKPKIS